MTDMPTQQLAAECNDGGDNTAVLRQEIQQEIHRLDRVSTRGLIALALFLAVSMCAWWGYAFLPDPETVTALLGSPPSARIISSALLIYTFSALLLSLSRMTAGIEHLNSFSHVGFLAGFYLFYYFGKTLEENYWAIFGSGLTILGVESYRIWNYCAENCAKKKEDLAFVIRTGRLPPLE
ncbi:MAG: menaquinol oxidoreductase [Desulfuromonadaceae bacterium]|nr:menaquinol oxidoreductase [Desulfuromonadaceae bacterium]